MFTWRRSAWRCYSYFWCHKGVVGETTIREGCISNTQIIAIGWWRSSTEPPAAEHSRTFREMKNMQFQLEKYFSISCSNERQTQKLQTLARSKVNKKSSTGCQGKPRFADFQPRREHKKSFIKFTHSRTSFNDKILMIRVCDKFVWWQVTVKKALTHITKLLWQWCGEIWKRNNCSTSCSHNSIFVFHCHTCHIRRMYKAQH